jgi:hypothetical protein
MPLDKVLSSSIANGAVTAALISNTANLVVSSLTANVITITTISGSANVTGDMTVGGNLTISGTTTYVNTTDLNIGDAIISLNADLAANVSPTEDAGLNINRGASTNAQFVWVESTDNWSLGNTTVSGILNANDTIITGTANVSTAINVGANVNLGTTYMDVGNSTVNTTITNITVSTNTVNVASIINIGANVNLSTSQINVGNSTVNTVITSTSLTTTSNTVSVGTAAYVVANGNVGIATNSPATKLHVSGGTIRNSGTNGVLQLMDGNVTGGVKIGSYNPAANADGYLAFEGYTIEYGRFNSSGNLGVGTSSPGYKLDVSGASVNNPTGGAGSRAVLRIADTTAVAANNGGGILFRGVFTGTSLVDASGIQAYKVNATDGDYSYGLAFTTRTNGSDLAVNMRLDASGNLGIGTSSPVARLQVKGSGTSGQVTASFILENSSSGTGGMDITGTAGASRWRFLYGGGPLTGTNALTEAMCILTEGASAGSVGIGTTSPASTLDVVASGVATGTIRSSSTTGSRDAKLRLNVPSTGGDDPSGQIEFTYGTGYTVAGSIQMTHTNINMKFFTGTTERARIDSSGNLGVGNTSPSARLHVSTSADEVLRLQSSGNPYMSWYSGATRRAYIQLASDNMAIFNEIAAPITFGTSSSERVRITSGGSFLIGKTSGGTYLNVNTAFEYLATTFTSGAGNFGYLALPQTPSVTLMLVNLTNQNNGNLNMAFLLLCNTRSTGHGGGNGVAVVSATQNSTGTGGEISNYGFAISGSGTSLSLRATCTLVSGSAVIDFTARIIQI